MSDRDSQGTPKSETLDGKKRDLVLLNDFYRLFLRRFWDTLNGLIGSTASSALLLAAQRQTSQKYPFIGALRIDAQQVLLPSPGTLADVDTRELIQGYLDFVTAIHTLLLDLTGGVMKAKLQPMVDDFRISMAETRDAVEEKHE